VNTQESLWGSRQRRPFRVVATDSKHAHPVAPNVLERDFEATVPNQKWLADLTDVSTDEGVVVPDLGARSVLAQTGCLGDECHDAARADAGGAAGRPGLTGSRTGPGASLRSRFAIRCW